MGRGPEKVLELNGTTELSTCKWLKWQLLGDMYFTTICPFFLFLLFRATSAAFGGSQARGGIGAAAAGLHCSHSHMGSLTHKGSNPRLHGYQLGSLPLSHKRNSYFTTI